MWIDEGEGAGAELVPNIRPEIRVDQRRLTRPEIREGSARAGELTRREVVTTDSTSGRCMQEVSSVLAENER